MSDDRRALLSQRIFIFIGNWVTNDKYHNNEVQLESSPSGGSEMPLRLKSLVMTSNWSWQVLDRRVELSTSCLCNALVLPGYRQPILHVFQEPFGQSGAIMYVQIDIQHIPVHVNYVNYASCVDSTVNRQCDLNVWQLTPKAISYRRLKGKFSVVIYWHLIKIMLDIRIKNKILFYEQKKNTWYIKKTHFLSYKWITSIQ